MVVTWGNNTTTVFGAGTAASSSSSSSTTLFGSGGGGVAGGVAPSTPPVTSTPAPSNPPPLGGVSTAPSSGGLFGTTTTTTSAAAPPAAPIGGLFGSASAPVSSGGLFGTASSAPAATGGLLFGSATPSSTTGGLFGSASGGSSSTSSTPITSFWSATTTTPTAPSTTTTTATSGLFGLPQPSQPMLQHTTTTTNPHQSAMLAHQSALQRQEMAHLEKSILHLHSRYSPYATDPMHVALGSNHNIPSSMCAFTAILYDPILPEYRYPTTTTAAGGGGGGGGQSFLFSIPKPIHISTQVWNEALARNPDPSQLMPVAIVGAAALHSRIVLQQEKANAFAAHAKKLRENLQFLESIAISSREGMVHSNAKQEALRRRLLELMRKVEIMRCMGQPIQRAEVQAQQQLIEISKQVHVIGKSLADIEEMGVQQAREWRRRGGGGATAKFRSDFGSLPLREEDKIGLFNVLNDQMMGMEHLGRIVNRDVRDAGILRDELLNQAVSSSKETSFHSLRSSVFGKH